VPVVFVFVVQNLTIIAKNDDFFNGDNPLAEITTLALAVAT
jgi:hypothetical protein